MVARLTVSMVVIGDEILGGFVQDTNSHWVAGRLQALGVPLERVQTVPDELDAIREALSTELARSRPRVVLTSGGIGSTPDDLTIEAVAATLGMGVRVEPSIDERISAALRWTESQGITVSDAHARSMRRMAQVPDGARLLAGAQGVTPGIAVDLDGGCGADGGATIVILPGVPRELRRIVEQAVEPELLAGRGEPAHVVEVCHPYPESVLNPVLSRIVEEFPDVHLGSYPGRECTIRLKGPAARCESAAELVRDFLAEAAGDPGMLRLSAAWQARWSGSG